MKVLFLSNDPSIFDATSATRRRMRAYAAAIGELHILSRAPQREERQEGGLYLHGYRPFPTILGRLLFMRALVRRARKIIRTYGIEVVSSQDPFEHGVAAWQAIQGTPARLHVQVHTDFCSPFFARESRKNALRVRLADSVLPHASGIRAVSVRVRRGLLARYGTRIPDPSVIPLVSGEPLAEPAPHPSPLSNPPFPFTLIAVGRLEREKRVDDIIRALALLVRQKYPVGLVVVGDGHERARLERLARRLHIFAHVLFLGARDDILALLSHAHAFVQASAYEGYGRTYSEAARAHIPMVVTDAGIVGEVFQAGESALVCPVGDINCLAREISRLIEDDALRHQLALVAAAAIKAQGEDVSLLPRRIAEDLARAAHAPHA